MSDLDSALSRANKLMSRKGQEKPPEPGGLARQSTRAFLIGLLLLCALLGGYAVWLDHSRKEAAKAAPAPSSAQRTATPAVVPTPRYEPTPVPLDPALEAALRAMKLNAILADPPRLQMNGKIFPVGSEILPGLRLKQVDRRSIVAEDAAGALYRRTF